MKRILCLLSAVMIGFSFSPAATFAIESDDKDLEVFLQNIGWDKQNYIDYLKSKDWTLEDFETTDDLGTPLTEESIQPVLEQFGLDREKLNALLVENGDIEEGQDALEGSSILFSEELSDYVDFYLNGSNGTPIDDTNLQELLNSFDFKSKDELEQFLQENDDSINNYEYIEDLEITIDYYKNGGADIDKEMSNLLNTVHLTDDELDRLFAHFEKLDAENPAFAENLMALGERMMAFENFDSADDLSAEQVAELLDISSSMLNLLQINTKYYLVHDGVKKPVSFDSLMTMTTTKGDDLLIEIYSNQGEFLADVLLTADMFGSELIKGTGNDIKKVEKIVEHTPAKAKTLVVKTVKGGKLPNTASDYLQNTLVGLAFIFVGIVLFRRVRVKGM